MDITFSTPQLCALFDVDARSIRAWQSRQVDPLPIAVRGKRGQSHIYDPHAVFEWGIRQKLNRLGVSKDGEILDLEQERARLAKEQADNTAMKNEQLRRALVPLQLLEWVLNKIATQIGSILDAVPLKIARRIPDMTNTQIDLIKREIVKAQNISSKVTIDIDEYERSENG